MTAPAEDPRGGEWIREEFRRAAERVEELPPYARPVVTRPIIGRGDTDSGGELDYGCGHPNHGNLMHTCPAGDRAQPTQELREAAIEELRGWDVFGAKVNRHIAEEMADALLALPAVAALLDAQAAVNRVEALAKEHVGKSSYVRLDRTPVNRIDLIEPLSVFLRRALDGTTT